VVVDKKQQLVNIQRNLEKFEKATQYLEDLKSRVPMQAMDSPASIPISANDRGLKLNIASSNRNQNLPPDAADRNEESKTPVVEKRANLSHS
jgi:hypothetical protein